MKNLTELTNQQTEAEVFVQFHYLEVKDLSKQFLTLISGTLVLSITFADKIVPIENASELQKSLLGSCWLALVISLLFTGLGIYTNFLAAEKARGSIIYDYETNFRTLAKIAYGCLDLAGALFGISLCLLALSGYLKLYT